MIKVVFKNQGPHLFYLQFSLLLRDTHGRSKVPVLHLTVVNKKVLACGATVYSNQKNPVP